MIFRPSESSKNIVDFYRRYLLTTFSTNNEKYNKQLKELLEKPKNIADGPYISMSDPFKKGKSIKGLVDEGILSEGLLKLQKFHPEDRNLYLHQEEAIKKIEKGDNIVVTTGTGSGKTESFLIPVIDELLKEKENGTLGPGVRTLIIYPMNALVNDQIRRIREILYDMDEEGAITFGKFTGETKHTQQEAIAAYNKIESLANEDKRLAWRKNEIISREQMRKTPPNILITNYAMLEYILLRPTDNIILRGEYADKWKYIVLDEAHSYNGANGIEVATLLKRVKAMLNRDNINFILTSATLGDEKSNDEIISFAESLCDSKFKNDSIIRSSTEHENPIGKLEKVDFSIYKNLAVKIRNNDSQEITNILEKYYPNLEGKDNEEKIYNLVLHDEFYYKVRDVLFKKIKNINEVSKELDISVEDFTDFIAVASNAIKNETKLFEARYHMFLRGIEGVFVTLKPLEKLFINKMDCYKENIFDKSDIGYKVYEITFCNNCNALFITGQIDEDGHLVQKSKFNDDYNPEVFLLSGEFDEDDEDDENENVYQICSKCGAIKKASSVNGLRCGHGKEYINKLIKVKSKGEILHACPCCHSRNSQKSILRPYYLGNEAATSVISTALYGELPNEKIKTIVEKNNDVFFGNTEENIKEVTTKLAKQFLAFSDNRQSAAFFASYLEDTYRENLIKRIMEEISVEKTDEFVEGMTLKNFVMNLSSKFKKYQLFPDKSDEDIQKEAWIYVLKEMSNYKAKNSLLKNGFLKFEADFKDLSSINYQGIVLSSDETQILLRNLMLGFMKDSAINTKKPFTDREIERFTFAGRQLSYDLNGGDNYIKGWNPNDGKTNRRLKYLNKLFPDADENVKREFLRSIWNLLKDKNYIEEIDFGNNNSHYQLNIDNIRVKKIDKLYICDECKGITPYNIRNICENPLCNGTLHEYDYKEKLKDNHYHYLFTKLNIAPMVVKEHTAQLSSERAYEYQQEFIDKKINVLSCSTTFEMGVDVGSLETVFMRDMPPSPANYVQRAGRAGRSLKSAAFSLTYCPNSSHDINYFNHPTEMIEGKITPPVLNINNEKIVLRHILASAFSFFWKTNTELFKQNIGDFIDEHGFEKLKEYLNSKPMDFEKYLEKVVPASLQRKFGLKEFKWVDKLFNSNGKDGIADIAQNKYNDLIKNLENERDSRIEANKANVDWITRSIKTIRDQRMIDFLSKNNIIPKYGFPVDTVELQEPSIKNRYNKNIDLQRDLISAISDYAPDSEVVADGKLYTSRYIKKLSGYEWPTYEYFICPNCSTLNRRFSGTEIDRTCKECGEVYNGRIEKYIIPKFGFVLDTEEPKDVGTNKPEKTYKGAISYIGDENNIEFKKYKLNNQIISVGNSKMDKLAILNKSPFYVCEYCGYGEVDEDTFTLTKEEKHKNQGGYQCNGKLHRYSLGHEFQTDVIFLKFHSIDLSDINVAWTVLYSLLEGLSRALNINRNELSGCLQWYREENGNNNFGLILFDNTPGGAGYVRQSEKKEVFKKMLQYGYKVVRDCTCGGEDADTTCYSCLCNYYNQMHHDILKRKYALNFYKNINMDKLDMEEIIENHEVDKSNIEEIQPARLRFEDQGRYQDEDTNSEIWNNLASDCSENEFHIIQELQEKTMEKTIEHPIYNEKVVNIDTNEEFFVRELWKNKKVMLFLGEDIEDYKIAKKTGWKCFCLSEHIDLNKFIELIEV